MTIKIAFANNKGGTGKTAVCVQTAGALARAGQRVLVIDMDPQANATRRLGITSMQTHTQPTISEAIVAGAMGAAAGAITPCGWDSPEAAMIDVLPSREDLLHREHEAGPAGALRRLARALDGVTDSYDFVLIDTRPDLGHLVQMALVAADTVIIVTNPGFDSIEAAIRVRDYVNHNAADLYNPSLEIGGVIVNQYRDTAEAAFQIEGLQAAFGDLVWRFDGVPRRMHQKLPAYIPIWTRFEEADGASAPLSAWTDRRGEVTNAIYSEIARRVTALVPTQATALSMAA